MKNEIKACYTATIVLVNGHKIELDGYFKTIEEAQELWELTKKQLEKQGYIQVASKYIYYINPKSISYVRIGLTTIGGPSNGEIKRILEEEKY